MTRLCWSRSNYCMPDAHNLFRIVSLPSNHARLNQEDLLRGSVRMALRAGCRSRGPHSALSVDEVIARRRVVPLVTINHTKSGPARAVQP
mmetsp:Transcript_8471/g.17667  ORF Transcript_8471/g.17667 Transcript_8471/m.17667 type:complete len:90 (-) Transcript_8471:207-476(-)